MSLARIGVIGDVHAEDRLLAAVLHFLNGQRPDALLCTGDIVSGPGDPVACWKLLRDNQVHVVRGNHDRWHTERGNQEPVSALAEALRAVAPLVHEPAMFDRWLASLRRTILLETVAGPLLLCHGLGENDMARLMPDETGYALENNLPLWKLLAEHPNGLVVCGHSHHRLVRRFEDTVIVNAGCLLRQHQPCCLLLDLGERVAKFYDLGEDGTIVPAEVVPLD
jgi:predicted phosphodiesterase